MSELLNKESNVQKENLKKYFQGSRKPTKSVRWKGNKEGKNNMCGKCYWWKEGVYKACVEK